MNIERRKQCEFFGFTENHEDESILIFSSCSSNMYENDERLDGNNFTLLRTCHDS